MSLDSLSAERFIIVKHAISMYFKDAKATHCGKTEESLFKSSVPHAYIISQNSYLDLLDFNKTLHLGSRHAYLSYIQMVLGLDK